jgi:hypothetical protein
MTNDQRLDELMTIATLVSNACHEQVQQREGYAPDRDTVDMYRSLARLADVVAMMCDALQRSDPLGRNHDRGTAQGGQLPNMNEDHNEA